MSHASLIYDRFAEIVTPSLILWRAHDSSTAVTCRMNRSVGAAVACVTESHCAHYQKDMSKDYATDEESQHVYYIY